MIEAINSQVSLNNGCKMPGYGYGVYKAHGETLLKAIPYAIAIGYRYIDTASFYENEKEVGQAVKTSGLEREQLFLVSKIWPTEFSDPVKALDSSLKRLGMDYLDGYLLHWPGLDKSRRLKTWEAILRESEKGKIRVCGVSNFLEQHLAELHENFGAWPAINQIEVHPHYQEKELCAFCAQNGIRVVSWSPLGRGGGLAIPQIEKIAGELRKTPAQIILRWQIQKNLLPIPKSVHDYRIRENAEIFDFSLDAGQMAEIDALDLPDKKGRTGKDPLVWPRWNKLSWLISASKVLPSSIIGLINNGNPEFARQRQIRGRHSAVGAPVPDYQIGSIYMTSAHSWPEPRSTFIWRY